jgi:amino acid adenylation domain-containing protein
MQTRNLGSPEDFSTSKEPLRPADRNIAGGATIVPDREQRYSPFPMTQLQAAYWIGQDSSLQFGNAPNIYLEYDCQNLDVQRLEAAWQKLIERHDMLHATVIADGWIKVLEETPTYRIEVTDLREQHETEVKRELRSIRDRLSYRAQRAGQWPPFAIQVAQLDHRRARIFMSFDMIFVDAWSTFVIAFSEWRELYEHPEKSLPPLDVTFRDYVLTVAKQQDAKLVERAREYWIKRLNDLPPAPRLPMSSDPSALKRPEFKRRTATLAAADWSSLRRRAAKAGLTPSSALLAAYSDVLRRWSEEPALTLNLPLFNREPLHPQVNAIVGDFTSVTLLEVRETAAMETFRERALRLHSQLWIDLDHRQFSGIEVQRERARQTGWMNWTGMPVIFTSLLWNSAGLSSDKSSLGWLGTQIFAVSQTPQVWLDCIVEEDNNLLRVAWDVAEPLFPEGMVDSMFAALTQHLNRLAADDAAWNKPWTDTARRLLPFEQTKLFEKVNDTRGAVSRRLLQELFLEQASKWPDQVALISGSQSFSYRELDDLSSRLACALKSRGARSNTLVAVVMEKGWEQVVAVLGILRAGAAYLPIDAGLPADRVKKLLRLGEVTIALTQKQDLGDTWPDGVKTIQITHETLRTFPAEAPAVDVCPEDLAYVIYTSGSTGEPKGVMINHQGVVNTIEDINSRFGVTKDDRVLALSSLSFDLSVYDIFGCLAAGAAIVIPDADGIRDPSHWADLVNRHGVTVWNSVPALMDLFVDYIRGHADARPRSLRLVLLSGDWIPVGLPDEIRKLAGVPSIISLGGATEASIWSILYPIDGVDPNWSSIPYGRAMANQSFHVLDASLVPCPVWVPGELFIAGIGLAKGYWRDATLTEASFCDHPLTGERLYRTGDIGRWLPDGNIEFLGRKDTQVKLQGFRAELGEIEAILSRHPSVSAAAVAAKGPRDGAKRLVAYVVIRPGSSPSSADLQAFLAEKLPDYMVPATYLILDALPLTPNGKVNRQALPEPPEIARSPEQSLSSRDTGLEQMRELVSGVLGQTKLDAEVSLLEYGATSIDVIRIVNRLDETMGYRPRIGDLYRDLTIAGLTRSYQRHLAESRPPAAQPEIPALEKESEAIVLTDPEEREAFKRTRAGLRRFGRHVLAIELDGASPDESMIQRYFERRSHRRFSQSPVPFANLSGLLANLSPLTLEGELKYLFGSAGGSYSVQTYFYAKPGRVESLPAGAYYFNPVERRMILITGGACVDPEIYDFMINRPVFESAAFALFFVAQLQAIEPLYGSHALSFATIETGLMAQLLEMCAPAHGIGLCQIGMLEAEPLRAPLGMEPSHVLLHSFVGGGLLAQAKAPGQQQEESANQWTEGEL